MYLQPSVKLLGYATDAYLYGERMLQLDRAFVVAMLGILHLFLCTSTGSDCVWFLIKSRVLVTVLGSILNFVDV
jgi:hypothetical protein